MKTLAVLLVTFGMYAHATNNASCTGQEPNNIHTAPALVSQPAVKVAGEKAAISNSLPSKGKSRK